MKETGLWYLQIISDKMAWTVWIFFFFGSYKFLFISMSIHSVCASYLQITPWLLKGKEQFIILRLQSPNNPFKAIHMMLLLHKTEHIEEL